MRRISFILFLVGLVSGGFALASVPSASAGVVAPPSSIDQTGTDDVTAALQAFIDSTPNGSTISFPTDAKYRIEGTLFLNNKKDFTLDGNGATFFATTEGSNVPGPGCATNNWPSCKDPNRGRSQWEFDNGQNITITDMTIIGADVHGGVNGDYRPDLEAQMGVNIRGTDTADLSNLDISHVWGDCVYVGANLAYNAPATHIHIHDNSCATNGRQGVSVTFGNDVWIQNNSLTNIRRSTIDFEPNGSLPSQGVYNVHVIGNTIGHGRLNFISGHGAGYVNDITISDNILHTASLSIDFAAPAGIRRQNLTITNNVSDYGGAGSPSGAVILIDGYDHVVATGNTQPMEPGRHMYMVGERNSCDLTVTGNDGANLQGQLEVLSRSEYVCPEPPPTTTPITTPTTVIPTTLPAVTTVPTTAGVFVLPNQITAPTTTTDPEDADVSAGMLAFTGAHAALLAGSAALLLFLGWLLMLAAREMKAESETTLEFIKSIRRKY